MAARRRRRRVHTIEHHPVECAHVARRRGSKLGRDRLRGGIGAATIGGGVNAGVSRLRYQRTSEGDRRRGVSLRRIRDGLTSTNECAGELATAFSCWGPPTERPSPPRRSPCNRTAADLRLPRRRGGPASSVVATSTVEAGRPDPGELHPGVRTTVGGATAKNKAMVAGAGAAYPEGWGDRCASRPTASSRFTTSASTGPITSS